MTNHKVKNATPLEYNNIQFKSRLEVMIYKTLLQEGFNVQYEPTKYIIWEGFKPNVSFYNKDKKTRMLKLDNKRLIDITYTPDFVFEYKDTTIVIEAKGFENDTFPIKKKINIVYLLTSDIAKAISFISKTKKEESILHSFSFTLNNVATAIPSDNPAKDPKQANRIINGKLFP